MSGMFIFGLVSGGIAILAFVLGYRTGKTVGWGECYEYLLTRKNFPISDHWKKVLKEKLENI